MTSKRQAAYVYVQLPGTAEVPGEWVTAGRVDVNRETGSVTSAAGQFRYAPSYVERPDALVLDPVGLTRLEAGLLYPVWRYGGLADVVRDACPDGWGRHMLQRAGKLEPGATDFDVALASSNSDRWGAGLTGKANSVI